MVILYKPETIHASPLKGSRCELKGYVRLVQMSENNKDKNK